MIQVKNYIQTGFSDTDAETLDSIIRPLFATKERIILDFSDIKIFTTLFFNKAITKYLLQFGPVEYHKKFEVINLSDLGAVTYEHSLDNAMDYYNKKPKERKNHDKIFSKIEE